MYCAERKLSGFLRVLLSDHSGSSASRSSPRRGMPSQSMRVRLTLPTPPHWISPRQVWSSNLALSTVLLLSQEKRRLAPCSQAHARSAPSRCALLKSAPSRCASRKEAPSKCANVNLARVRYDSRRIAPSRCTPLSLAPSRCAHEIKDPSRCRRSTQPTSSRTRLASQPTSAPVSSTPSNGPFHLPSLVSATQASSIPCSFACLSSLMLSP